MQLVSEALSCDRDWSVLSDARARSNDELRLQWPRKFADITSIRDYMMSDAHDSITVGLLLYFKGSHLHEQTARITANSLAENSHRVYSSGIVSAASNITVSRKIQHFIRFNYTLTVNVITILMKRSVCVNITIVLICRLDCATHSEPHL